MSDAYAIITKTPLTWNPRTWLSAFIRWRYGTWGNHSAIVLSTHGVQTLYEAEFGKGVRAIPFHNWKRAKHPIKILKLKETNQTKRRVMQELGKPYDLKSLFRHLWFWDKWLSNGKDENAHTCNEFVGFCFELDNWYKMRGTDLEKYL